MSQLTLLTGSFRRPIVVAVTAAALLAPTAADASQAAHSRAAHAKASHTKAKATHRKKRAKAANDSAPTLADALAKVPPYTGPTGAILHTKSVSVAYKSTDDPLESRGNTITTERWSEIGGGGRVREIDTFTDPDTGAPQGGNESWHTPYMWAVVPAAPSDTPPSEAVFCSPMSILDPVGPDIRSDQAQLASLPAGPTINGVATRVGEHTLPSSATPGLAPASSRDYLNAATGDVVRTVFRSPGAVRDSLVNDYSLWEILPAGGSAAELTGTLPADTQLGMGHQLAGGCIG